jgi:hypothetical protein
LVLLSDNCGGCQYCNFPYKAQLPIKVNGKYKKKHFNSKKDVWEVIDLLIEETIILNKVKGNNFDITTNVFSQIPFFTCFNHIRDNKYIKLINRYIYSIETSTPAYSGAYGEQPFKWVEYFFIIKHALAKKEKQEYEKMKQGANKNG